MQSARKSLWVSNLNVERNLYTKLKVSLKDKEASLEADVEKLVEKGMNYKA